jgi:DNA-binding transcriptional regulator WhiA
MYLVVMFNPEHRFGAINMPMIICKNCSKEEMKTAKRDFCSKGCATSFRQKAHDPNFFNISDEFSAYMLGLILTDGCVSHQEGKNKRLTIVSIDLELFEKLQPIVCPNRKIYKQSRTQEHHSQAYALVSTNEEVLQTLADLGIEARKTLTIRLPALKEEQVRHFIRGVFDGDGSIFSNHNPIYGTYKHIAFTTGSPAFADDLVNVLESFGFTPKRVVDSRDDNCSTYVKLYRKAEVKKFYDWIYEDAHWHMSRKKLAFYDDIV